MLNLIPKNSRHCNNTYVVHVTPEMAQKWLDINNFNRPRRPDMVAEYVRQIREGRWRLTHQGIAFTEDGVLLDGQHRLFAIVETKETLPVRVFLNEPEENFAVIDCGKNRTHLDTVRMSAKDSTLTTAHTMTLQSLLAGRGCRTANRWTNVEINEQYEKHKIAVNFAVLHFRNCKDKLINDRTVKGVIARAFYSVSLDVLEAFCAQLIDGGEHPSGCAVAALRTCLTEWKNRQLGTKQEIYRRCELVLEAFIEGLPNVSFDKNIGELFPLPGESQR